MCFSVTGSSYLAWCFQTPCCCSSSPYFISSSYQMTNIWIFSTSETLWIILTWIFMYKLFIEKCVFSQIHNEVYNGEICAFSQVVIHLTFPPAYVGSSFYTSLLKIISFYYCCLRVHEVVSAYGFDLHFPDERWCWTFSYVQTCQFYISLGQSFEAFVHFKLDSLSFMINL